MNLLEIALSYAERGWPVLPLHNPTEHGCSCHLGGRCKNIGKHPRYHKEDLPHGSRSAATDIDLIQRWWKRWPNSNIGIATGEKSFCVLDIDVKNGIDGTKTLKKLESKHGQLPETIEQITGGGGYQIFFKPAGITNSVKFAPGLDTRSDGGLVVVPPSLHQSGYRYEWDLSPDDTELAECPQWLLDVIGKDHGGKTPKGWETELLKGVALGERNHTGARLAGLYLARELEFEEVFLLLLGWDFFNKPPLGGEEIMKIVESIERLHAENKTGDNNGHRIRVSTE